MFFSNNGETACKVYNWSNKNTGKLAFYKMKEEDINILRLGSYIKMLFCVAGHKALRFLPTTQTHTAPHLL